MCTKEAEEEQEVEDLLPVTHQLNIDINQRNESGETALYVAAQTGQHRSVQYLIQNGANLEIRDKCNVTPLQIAARNGHFKCAKLLVDAGANVETKDDAYSSCPLISAVYWGFENIVQLMCISSHGRQISSMVAKFGYGPLTLAAFRGHTNIARMLLNHGANLEERTINGTTPLIAAAGQGNLEMTQLLVEMGASINVKNNLGETPLFAASSFGECELVKYLLEKGASLNKSNIKNDTPLHIACNRGHTDIAEVLLKKGADPNRAGQHLRTSLHAAALRKNTPLIKLLINYNADIDRVDIDRNTALDILSQREESTFLQRFPSIHTPPNTSREERTDEQPWMPQRRNSRESIGPRHLSIIDAKQILINEMINGRTTMNRFIRLCKRQFPFVIGMQNILFQTEKFFPQAKGFMQILSKDKHQSQWILVSAVSSDGCILRVYDPFTRKPHSYTTKCKFARQIRFTDIDRGYLTVDVMDVSQALCHKDTGPLVMAFTTDILHGIDPTTARYADTNTMKTHVYECFRTKNLKPFPRVGSAPLAQQSSRFPSIGKNDRITGILRVKQLDFASRPQSAKDPTCRKTRLTPVRQISNHCLKTPQLNKIKQSYNIELYCLCHLPLDNDMVLCDNCERSFHPICLFGSLPLPDMADGKPTFLCYDCNPRCHHFHLQQPVPWNLKDTNLKYDLFVSFSYEDMRFVRGTFMKELDRREGSGAYDLMVCERDWKVGGNIADTIVDTMSQSLKAVVILSKGFLKGKYTHYEWQMMAHHRPHASAVILLDRPDELEISSYLRTLLQSRIYLEWTDDPSGQARFWRKMKEFLGKPLHQLRQEMENEPEAD